MKATINNDLCAQCMSCVSNCPYQAATQRGDKFYVSSFCTGCGNCIAFCPTGAVSVSDELIELDNQKNDAALKELLGIKKPIVAMKYANAPLEGMETEEGPTFWCALCGNVCAAAADPIFFTVKSIICGGASLFGLGNRKVTKQEMQEAMVANQVVGKGRHYRTLWEMAKSRSNYPPLIKRYEGIIIGPLDKVEMPDLVILPVNGDQTSRLAAAYAYDTGNIITGSAGSAGCIATSTAYVEKKPMFTCGDHGVRTFMQLDPSEILVSTPYLLVPGFVKNLTTVAEVSAEDE